MHIFSANINKIYNELITTDISCGDFSAVGAWWLYEVGVIQPIEIRTVFYESGGSHTVCMVGGCIYDFTCNLFIRDFDFGFERIHYDNKPELLFKDSTFRPHRLLRYYTYQMSDIKEVKKTYLGDKSFLNA
jgi:hypothetical protein